MSTIRERRAAVAATKCQRASFRQKIGVESLPLSIHSFAVGFLNRKLRFLPRFPAAGNIPKIVESGRFQNTRRDAGAITASAIDNGGLAAIEFAHSFAQLRNENVTRARHVSFFPFTRPANIDNLERRFSFTQFVHAHLADSFDRKSG